MKLVVGLGNPGREYEDTRHNLGFKTVEALVADQGAQWQLKKRWKADVAEFSLGDEKILVIKPQTFMNRSGEAVQAARGFFKKVSVDNIIVVYDDADLGFGDIRIKQGGSSAGHRGIDSITNQLGNGNYHRVRVGIGRPEHKDLPLDKWVLQKFSEREAKELPELTQKAATTILKLLNGE